MTQHRLRHWWAQQSDDCARYALFGTGFSADIGSKRAQERGIRLLMENLSAAQRKQYEKYGYFDVTGGKTGKRYRSLVAGDIMLAQKAAIELFESDALRIAIRF